MVGVPEDADGRIVHRGLGLVLVAGPLTENLRKGRYRQILIDR